VFASPQQWRISGYLLKIAEMLPEIFSKVFVTDIENISKSQNFLFRKLRKLFDRFRSISFSVYGYGI